MLTVLVSTISNSQVFLLKKKMWVAFSNAKVTHIFSAKILPYMPYLMIQSLTICSLTTSLFWTTGPWCAMKSIEKKTNCNVRKRTFGHVRPANIQIRLRKFAQSDQNLHWSHFWKVKDAKFLHADNEDSDQTAQMRRLIWIFVGRTRQEISFLTLKRGSNRSHFTPGPSCSKLTMPLVNVSLKLWSFNMPYTPIFLLKMWVAFALAFISKISVN